VADLAAVEGDYYKAIEHYEKVSASSVSNNLMKWSVKDYFLKGGLCHLANGDMVATNRALEKYRDMDPTFPSTREHQLLVDLCEAVEAGDQEMFAEKLFLFDQMSKLDKWKVVEMWGGKCVAHWRLGHIQTQGCSESLPYPRHILKKDFIDHVLRVV